MTTSITKRYEFCSAHMLPFVPEGHKCKRMHGHNYLMDVTVTSSSLQEDGFIIDFWDLDKIVQPLVEVVDHRTLNDVEGLENPTAEIIAAWFHKRIDEGVGKPVGVMNVRIFETHDCWADYDGED